MKLNLFAIILLLLPLIGYTQDTINEQAIQKKNIVRWNITPLAVNATNFTLGYERILKNNRSFSVNAGLLLFPEFLNNDSLEVSSVEHGGRFGFTVAADYRFYLTKKNLSPAPEGVYIGPYITYYQYGFDTKLTVFDNDNVTNELGVDAMFRMFSLGFELGYQFVFWQKLTLDLILIGPSISYYQAKYDLTGDLSVDKNSELYKYLQEQFYDKYPWVESFVELDAVNTNGSFGGMGLGFRYVIQVGFHF